MEFYVAVDGKQEGPFAEDEVQQRIASGQLNAADHCWVEGWEEWKPLRDVFPEEFREAEAEPEPEPGTESEPEPAPATAPEGIIVTETPVESASARERLPVRHDRTSAGIFVAIGATGVALLLIGIGWLLGRGGRGDDSGQGTGSPVAAREDPGLSALRETEFSGSHLEQIAKACRVYAKANGGKLPNYATQLRPLFGERFAAVMDVPETPEKEESGYVIRKGLELSMPDDTPIAFEAGTRPDGKRGVVYLDGKVRVFARGDPELNRALAR